MRQLRLAAAFAALLAAPLSAQRAVAFEGGILAQYTKFDDFTKLNSVPGLGAHFDIYFLRRLALEYEGDFAATTSKRVGDLTALNNRIDIVYNHPLNDKWRFIIGGGWTGSQYHSDTTKNQYDSGGNAVVGFRYCVNDNWSWKGEGVADFKDPSDQTPTGERTVTYVIRGGINYFFGGQAKNGPCLNAAPAPPPPPPPAPAPRPTPPPPPTAASLSVSPSTATIPVGGTQQYTATVRDGSGNVMTGQNISWTTGTGSVATVNGNGLVRGAAAGSSTVTASTGGVRGSATVQVNAPAPPPPPAPAPAKPRELFTLHGVHFEFDKATLLKGAKDTLAVAVKYLKEHADAKVEVQGHTDSKGSDEYNMKLSDRRAESVKAFLVSQGIAASRITTKGFGESQPVADNETNGKDNPKGRAENRRAVIIEVP